MADPPKRVSALILRVTDGFKMKVQLHSELFPLPVAMDRLIEQKGDGG